jgi:hypothetical protein
MMSERHPDDRSGQDPPRESGHRRWFAFVRDLWGRAASSAFHRCQRLVCGLRPDSTCRTDIAAGPPRFPQGECATANTANLAGVVPHLAAYAGVMLALEQVRALLDPITALAGANTQSIMRGLDEAGRVRTQRYATCPYPV